MVFLVCFSLTTAMAADQRIKIAEKGKVSQIVVDNNDWKSVIWAAYDLVRCSSVSSLIGAD